ncbi:ubiquitin-like small modifier protein 1 [Halopenitus sp. H-Gu1]|uniref:ubiquitin-like small modifier protein 1 n=1 Tax=Halopenitus sp. H-Gu1 TaxID=3242697 RepID=UPI00359E4A74
MQVECRFFGPFREDVGQRSVRLSTDAETYGDLLAELERTYPELEGRLLADDEVSGDVSVTRNKRNIRQIDGLETVVEDGDVVRLTPSIQGGTLR